MLLLMVPTMLIQSLSNSDNDSNAVMILSLVAVVIDLAEVIGFR